MTHLSAALLLAFLPLSAATVITNARLADGTGTPLRIASLKIDQDRIVAVGAIKPAPGDTVIDATGYILAPGFIDTHNHSVEGLNREPAATSQVSQGITTVVLGPDGGSPWPISAYLQTRRSAPAAVNFALLAGHATIRTQVMGKDYRRAARPDEIAKMSALVSQAMEQGAFGLSTGLEYEVGSYSTTEEVIELARASARYGGVYFSHVRDEADKAFDSFREIIRIADEGKTPVQISHIKLGTVNVWGKAADAVRLIEQARARGLDVTADWYPYDAWASTITVLVPDKQYANPASVARALADVGGAQNITITSCARHRDYEMRRMDEIAGQRGITPVDLFIEIVKDGGAGVVCKSMTDADMKLFARQSWVMVASDGGIGMRHPRGAGTFPRVLGHYVREEKWLELPEAIRKMTSLPASRLALKDRGVIRTGAFADLVLFNPDTVIDRSTFAKPFELAEGIRLVMVNGEVVWKDGKTTGAAPGRTLERTRKP